MSGWVLRAAGLGFTAASLPGPFQTYLIAQTLQRGWKRGLLVALAPLVSDPPIILLTTWVVGQLPDAVLRLLQVGGAAFLLYLAVGVLREWHDGTDAATDPPAWQGYWQGVMVNLLSPGAYVFWTLVNGPLLVQALDESPWHGAAFLGGFYAVFLGMMGVYVFVFHQARRLGARLQRGMLLVSGIVLLVFAGVMLCSIFP